MSHLYRLFMKFTFFSIVILSFLSMPALCQEYSYDSDGFYNTEDAYNSDDSYNSRDAYDSGNSYNSRAPYHSREKYNSRDAYNSRERNHSRAAYNSQDAYKSREKYNTRDSNDYHQAASFNVSLAKKNYIELENFLPLYEKAAEHPWASIPTNVFLEPGDKSLAVLALRGHLKATGDVRGDTDRRLNVYDPNLVDAVKRFQARHGLIDDGIIGPATIRALNVSPGQRLHQIQLNMQRWSKLSKELQDRYILLNIPAYHLDLVENNQIVLSMKAVVGKPERPTPEIISKITRVVFNPYWNVPKTIAQKDIIPKIIEDPEYLSMNHIRVFNRQSNDAYEIHSDTIDWNNQEKAAQYHFRQDPGVNNALGLVKFEFYNTNDIYMHDTPAKNLFDHDLRAFSSGCIRLERPFDLATYLMHDDPKWNEYKIDEILESGETTYLRAAKPTKIVIAYLTTWVDENGVLQFRDDIYGLDNSPSEMRS